MYSLRKCSPKEKHCVVRWLMELIDYPIQGRAGLLVDGDSVASLTCLGVACR